MTKHALVVATTNRGKLREFRRLLVDLPFDVLGLDEVVSKPVRVVEDGVTFEQNARKKAEAVAAVTTMLTLADDSGLEVDALGGAPGVRSARFASERATDAENNAALLSALADLRANPGAAIGFRPSARFRCALAIVDPMVRAGEVIVVEGCCEGEILQAPRGVLGFGYDSLFVAQGMHHTLAEVDPSAKDLVSHRAAALALARPRLLEIATQRDALTLRVFPDDPGV